MWGWTSTSGVMTLEAMLTRLQLLGLLGGERGRLRIGAGAVGAWLGKTRVLVAAHVVPGPAIKAALLDGGDVVGDEVVAEVVALVGGAPELAGGRVDGLADAVADAVRRRPRRTCPRECTRGRRRGGTRRDGCRDRRRWSRNQPRPACAGRLCVKTTSRVQWPPPVSCA